MQGYFGGDINICYLDGSNGFLGVQTHNKAH